MSAERLREAARVLRERTEAATPGPWETSGDLGSEHNDLVIDHVSAHILADCDTVSENAAYIATMHPGVGLALANALDSAAEYDPTCDDGGNGEAMFADLRHLADLILGDAP